MVKFTFAFNRIILIGWKFSSAVSELRSEKHLELTSSNLRTTTTKTTRVCFFNPAETHVDSDWNMDKLTY